MTTSEPLAATEDLGKVYRNDGPPVSPLLHLLRRLRHGRAGRRELHALRGVTLRFDRGERVGLVGTNGAGKSTLLRILSGITRASSGRAVVNAKTAYLAGGGAVFFDALTGRENGILLASALGRTNREARPSMERVEALSGLGEAFDLPLRTYSRGMIDRLLFGVALIADAGLLLLDETFAAGDVGFRQLAIERLSDQAAERCIVVVSHDADTLRALCTRVVWLADGRVHADGPVETTLTAYEREAASSRRSSS